MAVVAGLEHALCPESCLILPACSVRQGVSRGHHAPHPHEVVRRGGQIEPLPDLLAPHVPGPSHPRHRLGPSEELLHQLSSSLALPEHRAALLAADEPSGPGPAVGPLTGRIDLPALDGHVGSIQRLSSSKRNGPASYLLSAPSVAGHKPCRRSRWSSIASLFSRSAVPHASSTRTHITSPCRFSVSACPEWQRNPYPSN